MAAAVGRAIVSSVGSPSCGRCGAAQCSADPTCRFRRVALHKQNAIVGQSALDLPTWSVAGLPDPLFVIPDYYQEGRLRLRA